MAAGLPVGVGLRLEWQPHSHPLRGGDLLMRVPGRRKKKYGKQSPLATWSHRPAPSTIPSHLQHAPTPWSCPHSSLELPPLLPSRPLA
jgi:hypothetical protein